jgi:bifunctional non-homologous end joining protein LigD
MDLPVLPPLEPMLAKAQAKVPPDAGVWSYEPKWDGGLFVASTTTSRSTVAPAHTSADRFPELCEAMPAGLNGHRAILDGEIVALDARARPCFSAAPTAPARRPALGRASNRVSCNTFRVRHSAPGWHRRHPAVIPGAARTARATALDQAGPRIVTPPIWSDIDGDVILDVMRQAALEGVVAKRATSPYQAGRRSRFWVKTPIRNAARLVVGGWIPASAREGAVGSLLVGGHDDTTGAIWSTVGTSPADSVTAPGAHSMNYSPKPAAPTHLSPISTPSATNRAPTGSTRSSSAASNTANTLDGYATPRGKASRPRTPRPRNCPLADDNPRSSKHDHRYGRGRRSPS